ncbi:MAG TPA: transcription elongation factor GreA [Nitriliruptorales bacterium]|nr:transcription elongation factor GreA [Nitriliruptorales bacterium]
MSETWLSQEAHDRLRAELEELTTSGRALISRQIEEARSHGDIRENAEYDAAKDEQGKMEARIRQLQQLLRESKVTQPTDAGRASTATPGLLVTVDIDGDEETYLLVGSREERHERYDVISTSSPLGRALLGTTPGQTVRVEAPGGALRATVKSIGVP